MELGQEAGARGLERGRRDRRSGERLLLDRPLHDDAAGPAHRHEGGNHVWSYDFVEDRTHDGRRYRMLNIIDEFTHECLAIRIDRRLKAIDVIDVLSDLFILRGVPEHIRSDNVLCREAALGFGQ